MADAVCLGELFQFEAGRTIVPRGPVDALGAQGVTHAHDIDQIPARITMLPLASVGVVEIAVQGIASQFIVESNTVVANTAGMRTGQLGMNSLYKAGFDNAVFQGVLRCDPGNQAGLGVREYVRRRLAIQLQRLTHDIEIFVSADTGKLYRSVPGGIGAGGFVIVPVECIHWAPIIAAKPYQRQ